MKTFNIQRVKRDGSPDTGIFTGLPYEAKTIEADSVFDAISSDMLLIGTFENQEIYYMVDGELYLGKSVRDFRVTKVEISK